MGSSEKSLRDTFGPLELDTPAVDLLTWTFERGSEYDRTVPLYFDADDASRSISAAQVEVSVRRLIAGLKAAGVTKGDCIVLHLFNTYTYTCLFFGAIGTGAAFTGTNPSYTVFELSHRFKLSKPRVVITREHHLASVQAACAENLDVDTKIFVLDAASEAALCGVEEQFATALGKESSRIPSVASLLTHGSSDWMRFKDKETAKSTIACMFSTSGTTGLPKVSQISHYSLVTQNISVQSTSPPKPYAVRRLVSLPFFNMFASGIVHVDPLRTGEPMYVLSKFDLEAFITSISKYQITDTATAPLMLVYILKAGIPGLKALLKSLRYIWNGSAAIDANTLNAFYELLSPECMIAGIWGMSETGAQTAFKWFERDDTGSVGRIVPGVQMKLIDPEGKQVTKDNVNGEAYVRSSQLMTSYVGNPAATAEILSADGWLRTGDICYVSDGKWYVVDRAKELIKVRGWQVAPAELEGVLVTHPKIVDAAVIGVKKGDSEAPRAFVLRAPGVKPEDLTEEEVRSFMGERLAKFKSLDGGIVFVDAIPKNMTGKTVKKKLTQMYPYMEG